MPNVCLLAYATSMSPEKARALGLARSELVYVRSHMRFFGVPDISSKRLEDLLDYRGKLLSSDVGLTTVAPDAMLQFNGVLYREVPGDVLTRLDSEEAAVGFIRRQLNAGLIHPFGDGEVDIGGDTVYMYAAQSEINGPHGEKLLLIRQDVSPDPSFLERCREAASAHGEGFREIFEYSTFLADRKTSLAKSGM